MNKFSYVISSGELCTVHKRRILKMEDDKR